MYQGNAIKTITQNSELIAKMYLTDLTEVRELMKPLYSEKPRGEKPRDPVTMLRSCILMKETHETSVTKWVDTLKTNDSYAILSGFKPDDVPGVGTFYDFIDRLFGIDDDKKQQLKERTRIFKRKPTKKYKKNEKQPPKHPDIINKLSQRFINNEHKELHLGQNEILQQIFRSSFVNHSAELGLLGDINNLITSGDGTLIKTAASHYGIKICDCVKKGISNCNCKRKFSDFGARWGWDSYREKWVYGYSFFEINACGGKYDLPIYFIQTQAQRNDGVSSIVALDQAIKLYPNLKFVKNLGDSAMDNYGYYKFLDHHNIEPFIDLNVTKTGNFIYKELNIDENGVPICEGGFQMVHSGYCQDRMRHKWRCPRKVLKSFPPENETICKKFDYCSKSDYGRTFYTYQKDNIRLFTKTPRGSREWKTIYKMRSASERSNKRKKKDYQLEQDNVRGDYRWMFRYALGAMCQHIDAWLAESKERFGEMCLEWEKVDLTAKRPT